MEVNWFGLYKTRLREVLSGAADASALERRRLEPGAAANRGLGVVLFGH